MPVTLYDTLCYSDPREFKIGAPIYLNVLWYKSLFKQTFLRFHAASIARTPNTGRVKGFGATLVPAHAPSSSRRVSNTKRPRLRV